MAQSLETVSPGFSLSIVLPVYNRAASGANLVRALENLPIAGRHEIVLVNDGSADDTLAVCRTLFERAQVPMTIVNLARNYGEHNAVLAGLRYASGAHASRWTITYRTLRRSTTPAGLRPGSRSGRGLHLLPRQAARDMA